MVVQVRYRDRVVTREFRVTAVLDHPLVWNAGSDQPLAWVHRFRDGQEMHYDPVTEAGLRYAKVACGGSAKPAIFSHPSAGRAVCAYAITGPIAIPDNDCEFRAFIGLQDGGDTSDDVLFSVLALEGDGAEHPLLNQHWPKCEWKAISADLSAFRDRTIRLKLIAEVGSNSDSTADQACWAEPRIVHKSAVMRIEVGPAP